MKPSGGVARCMASSEASLRGWPSTQYPESWRTSQSFPPSQKAECCYSTHVPTRRPRLRCGSLSSTAEFDRTTWRRTSVRNLFLRLLFALDEIYHQRDKTIPSSMYVPSRASVGDSNGLPLLGKLDNPSTAIAAQSPHPLTVRPRELQGTL